jgi:hypothetical protein
MVQLHKIKSLKPIRGVIMNKSQIKGLKQNWPKQRHFVATVHLLFQVFSLKGCLGCHLLNAFNALFLDQNGTKLTPK